MDLDFSIGNSHWTCVFPVLPIFGDWKNIFTIKNEKLRRFFISTYLNRDNSNATNPKDQDKLPLLGCIYYAVAIPLVTVAYIALIGFQISAITLAEPLWLFDRIFGIVAPAYCLFAPVMALLYRLDYAIGRRIHDILK